MRAEVNKCLEILRKGGLILYPTDTVWGIGCDATIDSAIKKVLNIALKNNLWIFSDECYEQLVYDEDFKSIATFTQNTDRILTFQSCSKTYAMTGWRIGYTAGDPAIIKAMSKLQGQSTSCPNSIAQYAAIEALTGQQSMIQKMITIFKERRELILEGLNSIDGIICNTPKGAFYAFPDISYFLNKRYKNFVIKSSYDLSKLLLEKTFVVTVAGGCFGSNNNIRFSYATSEATIKQMIERIRPIFGLIK